MSNLTAVIYGTKNVPSIRFENVRAEQTRVVDRVVVVGRTTFARTKDGKLLAFNLDRSIHYNAESRGALIYMEAAWRLGTIKKSVYDRLTKREQEKQAREAIESSAADALDNCMSAGVRLPNDLRKVLEKKAGR